MISYMKRFPFCGLGAARAFSGVGFDGYYVDNPEFCNLETLGIHYITPPVLFQLYNFTGELNTLLSPNVLIDLDPYTGLATIR